MGIEILKDSKDAKHYVFVTEISDQVQAFVSSLLAKCSVGSIKFLMIPRSSNPSAWLTTLAGPTISNLFSPDFKVRQVGGGLIGHVGASPPPTYEMNFEGMSDTMKQQVLQKLMSDLQKTYEMLSNMNKSMHDMQMIPIRNLRG